MKKYLPLMVVAGMMMLAATACKEKKQSEDIITIKYVPEKPKSPIRSSAESRQTEVTWLGRPYVVLIERMPADSLPMVTDETGQKYVDNSIRLTVMRNDSSLVCRKMFTKGSFSSYLDGDYRQQGVLDNMVFHKVEGPELKFAVVVSHPDSDDEFIPLELSMNGEGNISIRRGNLLDEGDRGEEYLGPEEA